MQSTYVPSAAVSKAPPARKARRAARPAALWLAVAAVLLAAIASRLPGILVGSGHGFDHWTMQVWTRAMVEHPLASFYGLELDVPQDHLPGDLLIFAGLGKLLSGVVPGVADGTYPDPAIIKTLAILADLGIGTLIFAIGRKLASRRAALVAMAAFLLSPGVVYVSSIWGQWDAVSALFAVAAVWLAMRGGHASAASWLPLAYACLIKPQYGLIAPFLLLFFWKRDGWSGMRHSAAGIVAGLGLVQLVASLFDAGLPGIPARWSLLDLMRGAVDEYDAISLNGHNIWILPIGRGAPFSDQDVFFAGITYQALGMALFALAFALILWSATRITDNQIALAWGSAATMMAMFVTMTRMHERYLFPALPLLVIAAMLMPRLRIAAVVIHLAYAMNIHIAYMNGHSGPGLLQNDLAYRLNALVVIGAFVCVMVVGIQEALACRKARLPSESGLGKRRIASDPSLRSG